MPNDILTLDYVGEEVGIQLGATGIEVELESKDIESCVNMAIRLYNRVIPVRGKAAIQINATQKKYEVRHPALKGVLDVQFLDPYRLDSSEVDPFYPQTYLWGVDFARQGETFGQYALQLQQLELTREVISAEPEWYAQWEPHQTTNKPTYYLYIDVPRQYVCSYTFTWGVTPDDDEITGMKWIPDGEVDWIIDFTVARAKQILSRIRGKFQGITGPDGGEQPVDWAELASEGREDEATLKEELNTRRRPLTPELG